MGVSSGGRDPAMGCAIAQQFAFHGAGFAAVAIAAAGVTGSTLAGRASAPAVR